MSETAIPAALAVLVDAGRVLLVRRRNRPDAGLWGYPGGKAEPGERPEQTALRELREETGIDAASLARLGALEIAAEGFRYRLEIVHCDYLGGRLAAADDAEEVRWFETHDVIAGRLIASRDVDRICLRAVARMQGMHC